MESEASLFRIFSHLTMLGFPAMVSSLMGSGGGVDIDTTFLA